MTIFRGEGGGGDATTDSEINFITSLTNSIVDNTAITTAAADATAALYDSFDDRYLGSKTAAPTLDNDSNALISGALYWNSISNQMFVWSGVAWQQTFFSGTNVRSVVTSTAGQTVVTVPAYTLSTNTIQVYVNGFKVISGTDYTETNTTSITFASGLTLGDEVEIIIAQPFSVGTTSADAVNYLPAGTGAVATTVQAKLRESVSVLDFGAKGDGTTDDTAAINLAITALQAMSYRCLRFPAGNYLISSALTSLTGSGWTVCGDGMFSTYITATHNGDIFSSDARSADCYFHTYADMTIQRTAGGTYSSSCGIRVKGTTASATGLQYATFSNLRLNNLYQGIVVEDTGKYTSGAFINNAKHGFFSFINIVSAYATDAMYECVVFQGGTGPVHTFIGGKLRGTNAAVRLGSPSGNAGIGDVLFSGVHVATAGVGIDIYGPSGGTTYNQNINISGCQIDNCTTATVRMDLMKNFRILPNSSTSSVGIVLTNCTNYIIEDRNTITAQGVTVQGSLNTTAGSIADTNGTRYEQSMMARRSVNTSTLRIVGGNSSTAGASIELFGGAHATAADAAVYAASRHVLRNQAGSMDFVDVNESTNTAKVGNGAWNGMRLTLGPYQLWVDSSSRLRIKNGAPTSDTDGTVVGTQV